ncbi:MAG: hypothetical protein F4113_10130 [Rhodothermaceae bacterium]|nr:hypothetical protein [Rhodothermaceae bacterium]
MDPMVGWLSGYIAGRIIDTGINKFNEWRKRKPLGREIIHPTGGEQPRQVVPVVVIINGLDPERDAVPNEKDFPGPIQVLLAEPHLKEVSKLMEMGQAKDALAYAKERIQEIDAALEEDTGPENRYVEALRTYRQQLLFKAASAASWLGDIETGRAFWWNALSLGSIDPKLHKQAVITLSNVGLKDELRHFVEKLDQESEVYRKLAAPCLAYLEKDWPKVDELLADAQSADQLIQRVEARLQIIDAKDIEAVKLTAELLDQTDHETTLPVVNLIRVQLTLDLITRVIGEYTPLDYDRCPLIDSLLDRIDVALETTEPDSFFRAQALGCLSIAAELLRDDSLNERFESEVGMLDEEIRSSVFPLYDSGSAPEKIHLLQAEGHFDSNRATILKAESYQDSVLPEDIEVELYEALFTSVDKQQRKYALLFLVQHLRRTNRIEDAQRLIDATPLRPSDNWLVRTENLPAGKTPLDLVDEVKAFPLDVDVVERLAKFTLSIVRFTSPENISPDKANLERAEEAIRWTTRLVEILPSRSSRLLHSWALYAARRYDELLEISRNLDPINAKQPAEFEAWALIGLGRRKEAIDCFISASRRFHESIRFVVYAARYLLIENQPEKAASLLKSHVTAGSQDPDILLLYAQSIHSQAPSSQEHASQAFDLMIRAFKLQPDPDTAQIAWQTARAAGREHEARRFFDVVTAEMPVRVVETEDDFSQALRAAGENGGVLIEGGIDYLAKMVQEDRKRSDFLGGLLQAHALSYTDFFRHSGRSWESWTDWTQRFEQRNHRDQISSGEFSVLAEWPSLRPRYDGLHGAEGTKLFLDQTAIQTLGVLGPKTAEQILTALGRCYVHAGTMEGLRRDLTRINGHLRASNASPYINAAGFFRQRPDAVVTYSDDIEAEAPDDPSLGPCRVDLGAAILYGAPYVTDLDNLEDWPEEANSLRISSAVLLASLNEAGEVTADDAMDAAKKHPNAFEGWNTAIPRPIPEAIVFDENSILDWVDTGLAKVLGNRVKVGPWVWVRISEESWRQEVIELAHERLKDTRRVLQAALDGGVLVEIEANVDAKTREGADDEPYKEVLLIAEFWSGALKSLRTAQSPGLQLWADDRFYPLLLRFGGPRNMGAGVHAIRAPFVDWAEAMPPLSTMELLNQLSSAGHLSSAVAQDAAAKLFSHGYRAAHPLLLAHTLRQYPVPTSDQLTPPFQKLGQAITEISQYCAETFDGLYGNRAGFIRVASLRLAERLIIGVWKAEGMSNEQRCTLASAFLEAVEQVFEGLHPKGTSFRADRTPISFWQGTAYSLQMMLVTNKCPFERYYAALRWFGRAAASRADQRNEVLRVLEDNFLDSLKYAFRAFGGSNEENSLRQIIATFVAPAFIPLTNASFNSILDPLLRRTVSMLARFTGGGRITKNYYHNSDRNGTPLKVSEEEDEKAAAEVLVRVISGDSKYARFIWGIDLVFSYTHPVPEEWTDEGFPSGQGIGVDVRCPLFTLLWYGPRVLRENIILLLVYRLAVIDPVLAYRIILVEDDLLSDDAEKVQEAHDRLGVELLRSGYFDLQRDLVHAVQRFRLYDADAFSQFIGWIGEDAAKALANHLTTPDVWQNGPVLLPKAHLLGCALLTEQYDDGPAVIEHVEQLISANNDQNKQNTAAPRLTEWLEDKVRVAEKANDPFVAAWAFRAVLLGLSTVDQDLELDIDGRSVNVSDWAANYVTTALAPNVNQPSEIEQRMIDRRQFASAALLLATFICSGYKHLEFYDQGEDPRGTWLVHVWLMATKLHIALIGLRGGLSNAADAAVKAVHELELDTSDVPVIDAFDPFAFGSSGDDIGIALTLTAMLKVVRQFPDKNQCPTWWSDTIQSLVEELANVASDKTVPSDEECENRFGLAVPLRARPIAQELIKSLSISR